MPRVRSWPCLLLAASLSFAASPEASGVDLFGGFDELRNSTTGNTCVGSKQGNASELASFSFKDNMKVVSSRKELSQELELNAQVTAVVGGANTQTKASMLNKFSRKSNSLYFLYNASASYALIPKKGALEKGNILLNQTGLDQLASNDPLGNFFRTCGRNYVKGVRKGAGIHILLELRATNRESQAELHAEFGVEVTGAPVEASGSTKLAKLSKEEGFSLSVETLFAGWSPSAEQERFLTALKSGDFNDKTFGQLRGLAHAMRDQVQASMACDRAPASECDAVPTQVSSVTLGDYGTASNIFGDTGIDKDSFVKAISRVSDNLEYMKSLAELIEKMNRVFYDEIKPFLNAGDSFKPQYNVWNTANVYNLRDTGMLAKILSDASMLDNFAVHGERNTIPSHPDVLTTLAYFWDYMFSPRGASSQAEVGVAWNHVEVKFKQCLEQTKFDPTYECGPGDVTATLQSDELFPEIEELIQYYYHEFGRILPLQHWAFKRAVSGWNFDSFAAVKSKCRGHRFAGDSPGSLPTKDEALRLAPLVAFGPIMGGHRLGFPVGLTASRKRDLLQDQ